VLRVTLRNIGNETMRNTHFYTLKQAAEAAGKTKPTIQRAIKDGKLSATKDENGHYQIDPAELHRVFHVTVTQQQNETTRNMPKTADETAALRAELEGMRALADERQRTIDDLRHRLDSEAEERRQITARLLEHQKPSSLWSRLRQKG